MSVELADEDDQTAINFDVITEVIVNISAIVALAQVGGTAAIPLQQQVNVCIFCKSSLVRRPPLFFCSFVCLFVCLFVCVFCCCF